MEERKKGLMLRHLQLTGGATSAFSDLNGDELRIAETAIAAAEASNTFDATEQATLNKLVDDLATGSFVRRVKAMNDVLIDQGRFFLPTFVSNVDVIKIEATFEKWSNATDAAKPPLLERMLLEIAISTTAPYYRSVHSHIASQLSKSQLIAPYLEKATLHFYRQDYFSCMLVLLPAVEKLILSHIGHLTDDKITTFEMRNQIQLLKSPIHINMQSRYETFKELVVQFLERFQEQSKSAATRSGSKVFRNRIFHVAVDDPYYTHADCVSMFNFVDLYLETLLYEQTTIAYGAVPTNDDIVSRDKIYWNVILRNYAGRSDEDDTLMARHAHYKPDVVNLNHLDLLSVSDLRRAILQALLRIDASDRVELRAQLPSLSNAEHKSALKQGFEDLAFLGVDA